MKTSEIIKRVVDIFEDFPEIHSAILFGSVAKGIEYPGSDLDIAVVGKFDYFALDERIKNEIDTLRTIEIVEYDDVVNERFKEEIDRYGKVIYAKAG